LKKDQKKSLIWYEKHNIIDPTSIAEVTDDYVKTIVKSMEDEKLIFKKK